MKGLLLKDFLYIRERMGFLLLLLLVYIVIFGLADQSNSAMFTAVIVMLTAVLLINAFSYDEQAKWDTYALSLPVSRNAIVFAKYLLAFSLEAGFTLLALAVAVVSGRLTTENLVYTASGFLVAMLFCAVLIPLFFRFGMQQARIVLGLVFLIPVLFLVLWHRLGLPLPSAASVGAILPVLPVFVVALFVISYFLSCAIYKNKEI